MIRRVYMEEYEMKMGILWIYEGAPKFGFYASYFLLLSGLNDVPLLPNYGINGCRKKCNYLVFHIRCFLIIFWPCVCYSFLHYICFLSLLLACLLPLEVNFLSSCIYLFWHTNYFSYCVFRFSSGSIMSSLFSMCFP